VVGAAARRQAAYDGRQPGDPRRAAHVLLEIAAMAEPPLRLPLGSDAIAAISASDQHRLNELERWGVLSASTDFDDADAGP
jgi:uncharacterized protein (DUF362 family)